MSYHNSYRRSSMTPYMPSSSYGSSSLYSKPYLNSHLTTGDRFTRSSSFSNLYSPSSSLSSSSYGHHHMSPSPRSSISSSSGYSSSSSTSSYPHLTSSYSSHTPTTHSYSSTLDSSSPYRTTAPRVTSSTDRNSLGTPYGYEIRPCKSASSLYRSRDSIEYTEAEYQKMYEENVGVIENLRKELTNITVEANREREFARGGCQN